MRTLIAICIVLLAAGCTSGPLSTGKTDKDIAVVGPTIMDARSSPSTIELNRNYALKSAEVLAEVKDFKSEVKDVRLNFTHVPLQIKMIHIRGTTWRADLGPYLKQLAVGGKTMKYDAEIVAENKAGQVSTSTQPVTINIKSPDLSRNVG